VMFPKKPIHLFSDFRDGHGKGSPFRYSVYMIHDNSNEKAYIGIATNPDDSIKEHFYSDDKGSRFIRRAVRAKGTGHFESEVIFATDSKSIALMAEIYYIWTYVTSMTQRRCLLCARNYCENYLSYGTSLNVLCQA